MLAPVLLRERSCVGSFIATIAGFACVAVNAMPYLSYVTLFTIGIGLLNGFSGAMLQVEIRKLAITGEPGIRGTFWVHLPTGIVGLVGCIVTDHWAITALQIGIDAAIAVLGCMAQVCDTAAYARGSEAPVNALSYLALPMTRLMAVMLRNESVSLQSAIGALLILPVGVAIVYFDKRRKAPSKKTAHSGGKLTGA